ncbi:Diaminopimelate decarboxylase [Streptomyces alboniger]
MTNLGETPGWGAAAQSPVTLERLLSVVGSGALELNTAPGGLGVAVAGVSVLDVLAPEIRPRELLLAVGVDAGSAHAVDLLRRAGDAGATGVVFGPVGPERATAALRTVAEESGTAVLSRTAWCSWAQLIGVLRAGLASAGAPPVPAARSLSLGDLNGLADAVALLVGGAVTIEDTESRVLAHSSTEENVDELRRLTILGRRVPPWRVAAMREAGFFRALWGTDDVLHRPAQGENPERLVGAVRAGGEVLGSIWVAAAEGRPLAPGALETLRAATRTAAAHLLHVRTRGADDRLVEDAAGTRRQLLQAFRDHPWLTWIHTHAGSQGCPLDLMARGVAQAVEFAEEVDAALGERRVAGIDIGGGLPVNFTDDEINPSFDTYVDHLRAHAPALFERGYKVVTEFGRSVLAKNGFMAAYVEYTKSAGGRPIAVTHAGVQVATRTVFSPEAWPLRIEAHHASGGAKRGRLVRQDIAGPACFAGDLLARDRALPLLEPGDLVVVPDTGAYYFSTPFHYNSLPEPAVHGVRVRGEGRVEFTLLRPAQDPWALPDDDHGTLVPPQPVGVGACDVR